MENLVRGLISEILKEPKPRFDVDEFACLVTKTNRATGSFGVYIYSLSKLEEHLQSKSKDKNDDLFVIAGVECGLPHKNFGKCNNALQVKFSASNPLYKAGPLAYEIAMWKSGGLSPDRGAVSSSAKNVWKKYSLRSDVESAPFDDVSQPVTPDPDDDCRLHNPKGATIDKRSYLNKSYRRSQSPPSYLFDLEKNNQTGFELYKKENPSATEENFSRYVVTNFTSLFSRRYGD